MLVWAPEGRDQREGTGTHGNGIFHLHIGRSSAGCPDYFSLLKMVAVRPRRHWRTHVPLSWRISECLARLLTHVQSVAINSDSYWPPYPVPEEIISDFQDGGAPFRHVVPEEVGTDGPAALSGAISDPVSPGYSLRSRHRQGTHALVCLEAKCLSWTIIIIACHESFGTNNCKVV